MNDSPDTHSASESAGDYDDRESLEHVGEALRPDYEVIRPLGRGAMATVYLAKDKALGVLVAVKVLRPGKVTDETARKRFEREARAAASMADNPNAVSVTRFGRLPDQTPYLVMQYVKGRTMEERVKAEGRLSVREGTAVLLEVASALAAAHKKGIIHRDVRPGNVLWDEEKGRALLTDFGIAAVMDPSGPEATRLTKTGQLLGDPHYLSPEQLLDGQATELTDVYLFGVLGYELLTGEGPYIARTPTEWIKAHLQQEPKDLRELRPDVPAPLADLLRRCLSREPLHRPSASDVIRALQGGADPGTQPGAGASDTSDLAELLKRRVPQVVILTAGAGAGLIQLADALEDMLPEKTKPLTVIFSVAGVLAATVIAWFHGERGKQRATATEYVLLSLIGTGWLVVTILELLR
ncbi:MAG: serine/threonine protein kinase [Gemmatimonadetes bacterium]|nr:serine/threonine protein kinase [Gemmatimonadota bacterium]